MASDYKAGALTLGSMALVSLQLTISPEETETWAQLGDGKVELSEAIRRFTEARDGGIAISSRAQVMCWGLSRRTAQSYACNSPELLTYMPPSAGYTRSL